MKTVILCGGLGTRLREETEFRPKPMVSVGGRPILWHIMKLYAHHGFSEFVLCLGYRGEVIKEYFLDYEAMNNDFTIHLGRKTRLEFHDAHPEQDFAVTLADTGQETMTGGRLRRVHRHVRGTTFLMTYGDGVADVNISELVRFHQSHGRIATVTAVQPQSRFGILDLAGDTVASFAEKPRLEGWMSCGFFVFDERVFDYLPHDDGCVLEGEPLQRLAADDQLRAYRHPGFFFAMDTYREYKVLNDLWDSGRAPWKVWAS